MSARLLSFCLARDQQISKPRVDHYRVCMRFACLLQRYGRNTGVGVLLMRRASGKRSDMSCDVSVVQLRDAY